MPLLLFKNRQTRIQHVIEAGRIDVDILRNPCGQGQARPCAFSERKRQSVELWFAQVRRFLVGFELYRHVLTAKLAGG